MALPKTFSSGERLFASDLNDNFDDLDGRVNTVETSGYRYAGTVYYTSSGTFTKADPLGTGDIGLRAIRVRMVGGGGGGSGAGESSGGWRSPGGGGGAAYAESFITNIAGLSASETVTRGSGGAGGTGSATTGTGGLPGGASSFGSLVSANGGDGARRSAGLGVNTGTGDVVFGGSGGTSHADNFNENFVGGSGGASHLGGGGAGGGAGNGASGAGQAGDTGGGGGAGSRNNSGGAGGNGIVIVDCFV